jgi:hypothetical protein
MEMWSDWYEKNAGKENVLTSAEFVLKAIDKAFGSSIDKIWPIGSIYIFVNKESPEQSSGVLKISP